MESHALVEHKESHVVGRHIGLNCAHKSGRLPGPNIGPFALIHIFLQQILEERLDELCLGVKVEQSHIIAAALLRSPDGLDDHIIVALRRDLWEQRTSVQKQRTSSLNLYVPR